ncbi:MAG: integrase, partial [Methylococcales bacterium]|nr:integrase [Methylococcales bacterium]
YRQVRAEYISETTNLINASLDEELRSLEEKTQVKRDELDQFRQDNNILSTDVNDNQARVRLQGLNDSLNKASEEEVSAKARLETVKMAMARGEALVPLNETESLAALEEKAQDLRELDAEIRSLYTPAYIKLRPDLNRVPEQLARIETKINAKLTHGKDSALTETRLEYQSAKQSVANIRKQLTEHKLKATKFTSQFSKYEALLEELLNLEKLFRETQQRLTALDINQRDKYPQVDVIDWAFLPHEPVGPLYMRDAGIALGISFFLGLLAVWLAEFLTREETQQSAVTLSGIHLYRGEESMALENQAISNQLSQNPIKLLENNFPRELTAREVNTLLKSADEQV